MAAGSLQMGRGRPVIDHHFTDFTMRAEPDPISASPEEKASADTPAPPWCLPAVILAAVVGLILLADSARSISATYDEVAYLRIAARWWRTGAQDEITRMGSPLTFWKLQQVPVLWLCDRLGRQALIDDPIAHQAVLLPLVRNGALWLWLVALALTSYWSRCLYGPRAMVLAAWLFVLSPNLLAHGALVTMELPLAAFTTGIFLLFWEFLRTSRPIDFWAAAALAGLAFSCKFTAVLLPPMLGLLWWIDLIQKKRPSLAAAWQAGRGMIGFLGVMLVADLVVTGAAVMPLAHTTGGGHPSLDGRFSHYPGLGRLVTRAVETPIPQDWVGFATQIQHQRSGGSSYLLGERRMHGWWYYYFVALAVKVPLSFGLLVIARGLAGRRTGTGCHDWVLPAIAVIFLAATAIGSSRNYGLRYLLPLAPIAIVWVSALAEREGWPLIVIGIGLAGQVLAIASVHPDELTYFNALAGRRLGGRRVLADSNLDWGQGLNGLARLQREHPELRALTLYYFGDTNPQCYGVAGIHHVIDAGNVHPGLPPQFEAKTPYVAVSASLQFGPWGPPGYFRALEGVKPALVTRDTTIGIYRSDEVFPP
jgi:hypothetical protein